MNIMEMVTKKCEEMKREILVEVGTILDQTRGKLAGAAIQMRTIQEANDQPTSKDEQGGGSDHHNGSKCGNARHGGENDANGEREREMQ